MYVIDKIYNYLAQKKKDFDSLLSSADDKLRELKSKNSRISTSLNFCFFLRICFGRRYKKLDKMLTDAEPVYEELVRKQGFMGPILQATAPTLEDLLGTKEVFDKFYQGVKDFVNSLDDIEKQLDKLSNRIQKKRFNGGANSFHQFKSNRVRKQRIRFFIIKGIIFVFLTCFFLNYLYK